MLTFRDPVHGYIRADGLEARLIQSRPMQRLRWVRQLGLTHLVYPGAEHSRFSHALGAMDLAGRMYDALAAKSGGLLETDARAPARRLVRVAALLHDIGHAPFSHSAEELFAAGVDHEAMSLRLIDQPELAEILGDSDGALAVADVRRLLAGGGEGDERLLGQIVSSELDVDKMDYLLRDSLFCGVRYGNYDLPRLLDTVVPLQDPASGLWGIGIDEGGVHAYEALVMARYYMFTQVYFNVTGKILELHLNEWLAEEDIEWPNDPDTFLHLDDLTMWSRMRTSESFHARAILKRRHYGLAFETGEHLRAEERHAFTALVAELRHQDPEAAFLVSNARKDAHRLGESRVFVERANGSLQRVEEASHFIAHLRPIDRFRVYTPEDMVGDVRSFFSSRWPPD